MKNKLIVVICLIIGSCNSYDPPVSGTKWLSKEKMVEILLEVHLTESSFNAIERNKKKSDSLIINEYSKIFKKHQIKPTDFFSTYNYYLNNPALLDSAYLDLVSRITTLQSQMQKNSTPINLADTMIYKDSIKNQIIKKFKERGKL